MAPRSNATRQVGVRLSLEDAARFERELARTGKRGRRSLEEIAKAARPANDNLKRVNNTSKALLGSVRVLEGPLGGVAGRMTAVSAALTTVGPAALGAAAGLTAVGFAVVQAVRAGADFERSQFQTQALLRATEQASGQTVESIEATARRIGRETLASTQEVRAAANQLLTFRSIAGDTFTRTLELAQDLAALGFGSLSSQAVLLARALEDPSQGLTRLRRIGVSFTKEQEDLIKSLAETGRLAEAQGEIFRVLERQVGGNAVAAAQGFAGAIDTATENYRIFFETLGRSSGILDAIASGLNLLADGARRATQLLEERGVGSGIGAINERLADALREQKSLLEQQQALEADLASLPAPQAPGERGPVIGQDFGDALRADNDRRQATEDLIEVRTRLLEIEQRIQDIRQARATASPNLASDRSAEEQARLQRDALRASADEIVGKALPNQNKIEELRGSIETLERAQAEVGDEGGRYAEAIAAIRKEIQDLATKDMQELLKAQERAAAQNAKVIADLERRSLKIDDPREASIQTALARLSPDADQATRDRTRELAGQNFDDAATAKSVTDRETRRQSVLDTGRQLTESLRTAQESYNASLTEARLLQDAGAISQETYNRAVRQAEQDLQAATFGVDDLINSGLRLSSSISTQVRSWEDLGRVAVQALTDVGVALAKTEGEFNRSGGFFDDLFAALSLDKAGISSSFGSDGGGRTAGGGSGGGLGGGSGGGSNSVPDSFATGGSFMVGGSGSTDSQRVQFNASPNERVDILTPQQQVAQAALINRGRAGGRMPFVFQLVDQRRAGSPPIETQPFVGPDGVEGLRAIVRDELTRQEQAINESSFNYTAARLGEFPGALR